MRRYTVCVTVSAEVDAESREEAMVLFMQGKHEMRTGVEYIGSYHPDGSLRDYPPPPQGYRIEGVYIPAHHSDEQDQSLIFAVPEGTVVESDRLSMAADGLESFPAGTLEWSGGPEDPWYPCPEQQPKRKRRQRRH